MTQQDAPKSVVEWEQPPPPRSKRYNWDAIAAQLRERPLEWAKVFDRDRTSLATAIRIDGIKALLPSKGFEVRTTNNVRLTQEDGKELRLCTLYLRYVPSKDRSN
jgi:hypothetical protein